MNLSPKQLDQQSTIKIDEWIDIHSERCKEMDDLRSFTLKCMRIGLEDQFLFTDRDGRLWGKGKEGKYYPFHLEDGKKLIGLRLSIKAAN